MGVTGIFLSLRYKAPIAIAWSTSGAAMLITGASGVSPPDATGAFIVSGLLSGVLLRFGIDAFASMTTEFAMTLAMFCAYLAARRWLPRYAVIVALLLGVAIAGAQGRSWTAPRCRCRCTGTSGSGTGRRRTG